MPKLQATTEQIQDKVKLVLRGYPKQGVELPLLITITLELLRDDRLKADRIEVSLAVSAIRPKTRKIKGELRYFLP